MDQDAKNNYVHEAMNQYSKMLEDEVSNNIYSYYLKKTRNFGLVFIENEINVAMRYLNMLTRYFVCV